MAVELFQLIREICLQQNCLKKKSEGFVLFFVNGKKSLFLHPFFADFVSFHFPVSRSHCREEKKTQHQCGQIVGATITQVFFHFLPSPEKTYNNF